MLKARTSSETHSNQGMRVYLHSNVGKKSKSCIPRLIIRISTHHIHELITLKYTIIDSYKLHIYLYIHNNDQSYLQTNNLNQSLGLYFCKPTSEFYSSFLSLTSDTNCNGPSFNHLNYHNHKHVYLILQKSSENFGSISAEI